MKQHPTAKPVRIRRKGKETRILIVGIGALGGTIAVRALNAGISVFMAVRNEHAARSLRFSGLELSGLGESIRVPAFQTSTLQKYRTAEKFDLILLATKAEGALEISPQLCHLLAPGGTIVPIQNGSVSLMLADRLGSERVLGAISNLAATMVKPGRFEQRNAGDLILGEVNGGVTERAVRVAEILGKGLNIRVSSNLRAVIWAKLLINCSVTTLGAITGQTMHEYIGSSIGKEVFRRAYDEALTVALASGIRPERMIVEPIPPGWQSEDESETAFDDWLDEIIKAYGKVKASMLQDLERGRRTEIDFINGYVAKLGGKMGLATPTNSAITELIHQMEQKHTQSHPEQLHKLLIPSGRNKANDSLLSLS